MAGRMRTNVKTRTRAVRVVKAPVPRTLVPKWEEEEICLWLALTDCIQETARICRRAAATVWKIRQEHADHILRLRVELSLDLRSQFDATIRCVQAKIRQLTGQIKTKEDALVLAEPLFVLSKTVAIQTERRQVISDKPGTIARTEQGGEVDAEKESDKVYLRQLLEELREARV